MIGVSTLNPYPRLEVEELATEGFLLNPPLLEYEVLEDALDAFRLCPPTKSGSRLDEDDVDMIVLLVLVLPPILPLPSALRRLRSSLRSSRRKSARHIRP